MSALQKIAKLQITAPTPEKRAAPRRRANALVHVGNAQGESCKAELRDISPFGCSLHVDATWLRTGKFVSIRLNAERMVEAVVRWSRDGANGVEFLRPISEAETDRIAALTE